MKIFILNVYITYYTKIIASARSIFVNSYHRAPLKFKAPRHSP